MSTNEEKKDANKKKEKKDANKKKEKKEKYNLKEDEKIEQGQNIPIFF